jgi:hypothetical protein
VKTLNLTLYFHCCHHSLTQVIDENATYEREYKEFRGAVYVLRERSFRSKVSPHIPPKSQFSQNHTAQHP